MRICEYGLKSEKIQKKIKIAVISDLHGSDVSPIAALLIDAKPDVILASGDILERIDGKGKDAAAKNGRGFELLSRATQIAPTFYSLGNHEIGGSGSWGLGFSTRKPHRAEWSEENLAKLKDSGAYLLDDSFVLWNGFVIGGLTSGILNDRCEPNLSWIDEFCRVESPKILLCHHPEYYEKYLRQKDIDLIVSGHAHGGQWRFFGRGVFSPGQGLFPKYTKGVYETRLIVSTGLKRGGVIPRIFNSPEVVIVSVN